MSAFGLTPPPPLVRTSFMNGPLGLLLKPFKLQVRWRGSLLRHASVRICSLYWLTMLPHSCSGCEQRMGVLLGFEHEENWRVQNMTGMYLLVTVLFYKVFWLHSAHFARHSHEVRCLFLHAWEHFKMRNILKYLNNINSLVSQKFSPW